MQCTEAFYKDNIAEELKSRPSDPRQREHMLKQLRAFEEGNEDFVDSDDEDDDDGNDISRRFEGLDIDNADVQSIWNRLTPEEQQKFFNMIDSKNPELEQVLKIYVPWWETPYELVSEVDTTVADNSNKPPELPDTLPTFDPQVISSPTFSLILNLIHCLMVYAYLQRHSLGELHDSEQMRELDDVYCTIASEVLFTPDPSDAYASMADVAIEMAENSRSDEWDRADLYSYAAFYIKDAIAIFANPTYMQAALSDLYRFAEESEKFQSRNKRVKARREQAKKWIWYYLSLALELAIPEQEYIKLLQFTISEAERTLRSFAEETMSIGASIAAVKKFRKQNSN
ncbi:unnamed protein product [Umbelopsis sp. WA50703]|jgi:hypothetical protein